MVKLTQIYIYPIKSLPGISLKSASVKNRGLEWDRRWMLVDSNDRFITLREFPVLTQFNCEIDETGLLVRHEGSSIKIVESAVSRKVSAQIWTDEVEVKVAAQDVNDWFTENLDVEVRLVKICDDAKRNLNYNEGNVSLADRWPYLILGTKSVAHINTKLAANVDMLRFRPNLVVSTTEEYEEDLWQRFTIGNIDFEGYGPCGRCQMVNIDAHSGEIGENVLKVLSSYRTKGHKIVLGLQAASIQTGIITVGDSIDIQDYGE